MPLFRPVPDAVDVASIVRIPPKEAVPSPSPPSLSIPEATQPPPLTQPVSLGIALPAGCAAYPAADVLSGEDFAKVVKEDEYRGLLKTARNAFHDINNYVLGTSISLEYMEKSEEAGLLLPSQENISPEQGSSWDSFKKAIQIPFVNFAERFGIYAKRHAESFKRLNDHAERSSFDDLSFKSILEVGNVVELQSSCEALVASVDELILNIDSLKKREKPGLENLQRLETFNFEEHITTIRELLGNTATVLKALLAGMEDVEEPQALFSECLPLRVIKAFAGRMIEVELHVLEEPRRVNVPASIVRPMMINLLTNAHQAMMCGGTLKISEKFFDEKLLPSIKHQYMPLPVPDRGDFVGFFIEDTGIGMSEAVLGKIFEFSFSTKRTTGIGLATIREMVRIHGGFIGVDSRKGHGSLFVIYLPAA